MLTITWAAKFAIHVAALALGLILAYATRLDLPYHWWLDPSLAGRVFSWAALYALIGGCVEGVFQAERGAWRFASARDLVALARNVTVTTALFLLAIFFLDRGERLPRSVLPLAWVFSLAFLVAARMAWRLPREGNLTRHLLPAWWRQPPPDRPPLIVVGAMGDADRQLRHLMADPDLPYRLHGVITPNANEVGTWLHGVPFLGSVDQWKAGHLSSLERGSLAAFLFLDDPVTAFGLSAQRVGDLRRAGHKLLRPLALSEIDAPEGTKGKLTEIPLEEFLPRQPIKLASEPVAKLIQGKRVLVTGAGGSIGSEICRQMAQFGCGHLTLLDHSEFLLFEIDRELGAARSAMTRRAVLASVRDEDRVKEVFAEESPDLVFHAAALKHVTLVEENPAEGVLTNVLGTWNVMRAAIAAGAAQFVLISTDKAVAPTNVMGATKRIAETLLELAPACETRLSAVRFGNVLGSAGSVVPIFRDQIARGGPVTVTHPEVNRYFMTIPEAVQLVLHSTAIKASRSDIGASKFLLEMGEPVRIADLARQMIELTGQRPDVDVRIEFTGLKKGEKIAEVLADEGEDPRPCTEGILEVMRAKSCGGLEPEHLQLLIASARAQRDLEVAGLVTATVEKIRKASALQTEPLSPG